MLHHARCIFSTDTQANLFAAVAIAEASENLQPLHIVSEIFHTSSLNIFYSPRCTIELLAPIAQVQTRHLETSLCVEGRYIPNLLFEVV